MFLYALVSRSLGPATDWSQIPAATDSSGESSIFFVFLGDILFLLALGYITCRLAGMAAKRNPVRTKWQADKIWRRIFIGALLFFVLPYPLSMFSLIFLIYNYTYLTESLKIVQEK